MWIADVQNTFLVNCFSTFSVAPLLTLWWRIQTSTVPLRTFNTTCRPPHLPIPFHSRQHYLHVRHGEGLLIRVEGAEGVETSQDREWRGGDRGTAG